VFVLVGYLQNKVGSMRAEPYLNYHSLSCGVL
jgi:hypothetical protein